MTTVLAAVRGVAADLVRPLAQLAGSSGGRRSGDTGRRTHLEVRGVHRPEHADAAALVEKHLRETPGVRAAAVNAVLGRVVVEHGDELDDDALIQVVVAVEEALGLHGEPACPASSKHPADATAHTRHLIALGTDLVGLGITVAERWLVPAPVVRGVPPILTAGLSLADAVPGLRGLLERTAGDAVVESWFALGSSTAQALGRGPVGLVADACYRAVRAAEAAERRRAFAAWDAEVGIDAHRADAHDPSPRPVPLSSGVLERVADTAGAAAVAGSGLAAVVAPGRATAVLLSGVPKAARWGREAFAAAAIRSLCADGVVVVDPTALRRADRVDAVVLDAATLPAGLVDALREPAARIGRVVDPSTRVPAGGPALADRVRALQQEGHGVLVLTGDPAALAAADIGVAVGEDVPWTADLRCADPARARRVLDTVAAAPAVSRRVAALAVLASVAALPTALLSPVVGASGRANLPVTVGALLALGVGTWWGTSVPETR